VKILQKKFFVGYLFDSQCTVNMPHLQSAVFITDC